jgi:hypothetical protein
LTIQAIPKTNLPNGIRSVLREDLEWNSTSLRKCSNAPQDEIYLSNKVPISRELDKDVLETHFYINIPMEQSQAISNELPIITIKMLAL